MKYDISREMKHGGMTESFRGFRRNKRQEYARSRYCRNVGDKRTDYGQASGSYCFEALGIAKTSTGVAGSLGSLGGAVTSAGRALATTGASLAAVTGGLSLLITFLGAGVAAWGMFNETIKRVTSVFRGVLRLDFTFQVS
jgi:hypothetical protein